MGILSEKFKIKESAECNGAKFEVLELDNLEGALNPKMGMEIYFGQQAGLKMRLVRVTLKNSSLKTEAGALYFYKGNLDVKSNFNGVGGFIKKSLIGGANQESIATPLYTGTGEIYLEPSFKHYFIISLDNDCIIVDKGMFFCCSGNIEVSTQMQKNVSSAVLGGEGLFQIKLSGTGIVVLESSVPGNEIELYELEPQEVLKVDGNFAIARNNTVDFSVTKSEKGILGNMMNGEGLLNTFTGPGFVWLAPTDPFYKRLQLDLGQLNNFRNSTQ